MNQKYIENLLVILISLIPISILIGPAISLANILIFDFLFIIILFLRKDFEWINSSVVKILLILYLYLIFNSLIAQQPELSLLRNLGFIRLIILFVGINYFLNKSENLKLIFKVWSLTILIVVIDIFIEKNFGKNIFGYSAENSNINQRLVSFFKDEQIPGSFIHAFSFMLVGFFVMKFKEIKIDFNIYLTSLIILILFASVIITGERSNSIKFLISFIIFLVLFNEVKIVKKIIIFCFISLIIILTISSNDYLKSRATKTTIYLIKTYKNSFQSPNPAPGGNPYAELNRSGFEIFKKYPFFGVGNKNYRYESCKKGVNKYYYCETHPHQIYFEFLSEHGSIGGAILIILFFSIFLKIIKIIILNKNYISLGCFVYLLTIFTPLLPSGSFFSDYNITLFFINMSVMYGSIKELNIFEHIRKI
jgi:O-antigen ligase